MADARAITLGPGRELRVRIEGQDALISVGFRIARAATDALAPAGTIRVPVGKLAHVARLLGSLVPPSRRRAS